MPTFNRADQEQIDKARDLLESEEARESGFAKSLFFGRLKLDQLFPYPHQDDAERRRTDELIAKLDRFLQSEVDPDRIDAEERIGQPVIDGLGQLGVLGMTVPTEFGGGGFTHSSYCRVLERVGRHCTSTAVLIGAHQSIGLKALMLMGTEEQKRKYLPSLASGRTLAAFCLSEPEVGSDAASVQTTARPNHDGSGWIINGEKRYATNAALAGFLTVMAKTPIRENGKTRDKVTAFIVTPDTPGFQVLQPNRSKCGIRGSWQAHLRFTDMPVPNDQILGQLGKGLKVALSVLDYGRCSLSAGCVGGAKKALELAVERARTRRQFGRRIGDFHLIKQKIARMAEMTFAMDALTYHTAGLVDEHRGDLMLETAMCKLFCSEGAWSVIDDALQIWGGEGYMRDNGIERMLRDARINRIVEGTTEVMTAFVALIGMKGVGEDIEHALKWVSHPVGNFGRLARFAREQWDDILIGHSIHDLHPELADQGKSLANLTTHFARAVLRLLATHRQGILDMELIHERVTAVAIELYAMAVVLSKLQSLLGANGSNGHDPAIHRDIIVGKGYCNSAARRIRTRLHSMSDNDDSQILTVADAVLGPIA